MSNFDSAFRDAQRAYDNMEPPEDHHDREAPKPGTCPWHGSPLVDEDCQVPGCKYSDWLTWEQNVARWESGV